MKKAVLLLLMLFGYISITTAQDLQKRIFGVDVAVNMSSLVISGTFLNIDPSIKLGFNIGASYQHLLLPSKPLYLETGVYFSQKGAIYKEGQLGLTLNTLHVQVPLLVNYRFDLGSDFMIIPALGLYYSSGIVGNYKLNGTTGDSVLDNELKVMDDYVVYGAKGELKRSNMGFRIGVGFAWMRINLTLGYERDLLNASKIEKGVNDRAKTKNQMFTLSVGYRF